MTGISTPEVVHLLRRGLFAHSSIDGEGRNGLAMARRLLPMPGPLYSRVSQGLLGNGRNHRVHEAVDKGNQSGHATLRRQATSLEQGMRRPAQADTASLTSGTSSPSSPGDDAPTRFQGNQGDHGKGFNVSVLATKLGLPKDTVSDALGTVRDQIRSTNPSFSSTQPCDRHTVREKRQVVGEALAVELGIEDSIVSTALEELRVERTAAQAADERTSMGQAVIDGTLTRGEADAVQKAIDAGIVATRDDH